MIVGHDWGGLLAWAVGTLHPRVVRRLAVLAAPHPLRMRAALVQDPRGQLRASSHLLAFQTPRYAERLLTGDDARYVARLFGRWAGGRWQATDDSAEAVRRCREAIQIPAAAHCALEYFRWAVRSLPRPDGIRFARRLRSPVRAPVLQLHGELDRAVLPSTAVGSGRYVDAPYTWCLLGGVGHVPHEESPAEFTKQLLEWLAQPPD
jgi:pimeloyl-ACP methyl ester carboxylesterase